MTAEELKALLEQVATREVKRGKAIRAANEQGEIHTGMPLTVQTRRVNGHYTVALFHWGDALQGIGVAKRNPIDPPNPKKGEALAIYRAAKDYLYNTGVLERA